MNFVIHKELKRQIARTGKIKFHSGGCGCQSGNYKMQNFEKGKSITTNADRTLKRSMRRNLHRYKLRREALIEVLKECKFITEDTILSENGNRTTFETYRLRVKALTEEISLEEFARVLIMINKKRGYKSSRKAGGQKRTR